MPTSRSADAAEETSTEGTAPPFGIADAAPARKDMEEAEASDNPGQVPPRWDQMTRKQRKPVD